MNNIHIGVDPGSVSGCIALIYTTDGNIKSIETIEFAKYTTKEWFNKLKSFIGLTYNIDTIANRNYIYCTLEKVHSFPGMSAQSTFAFARNVGHIEMALLALNIPFKEITPQVWMKYYNLKKMKDESKPDWKRRLREYLQRILPDIKITNNIADAILIAYYTMKINQ